MMIKFATPKLEERLKSFYCQASLAAWAGGHDPTSVSFEFPGEKIYRFERKGLLYIDRYFVNGRHSGGQTAIWLTNNNEPYGDPIWLMHYVGFLTKTGAKYEAVMPFVRRTLVKTYEDKQFCGGRGASFAKDDLIYSNTWSGKFRRFDAEETVRRQLSKVSRLMFWYRVRGEFLVPFRDGQPHPCSDD